MQTENTRQQVSGWTTCSLRIGGMFRPLHRAHRCTILQTELERESLPTGPRVEDLLPNTDGMFGLFPALTGAM